MEKPDLNNLTAKQRVVLERLERIAELGVLVEGVHFVLAASYEELLCYLSSSDNDRNAVAARLRKIADEIEVK